jgi:hypothetical protein
LEDKSSYTFYHPLPVYFAKFKTEIFTELVNKEKIDRYKIIQKSLQKFSNKNIENINEYIDCNIINSKDYDKTVTSLTSFQNVKINSYINENFTSYNYSRASKSDKTTDEINIQKDTTKIENIHSNINNQLDKLDNKKISIDLKKDYEYTRANLYSLIEKGQEAINGILELAGESDSPRAYEVAGQLIKSVGDVSDKLMDLQKKLKDVEETSVKTTNTVNNTALFVGSTSELSKILKQGFLNNKEGS